MVHLALVLHREEEGCTIEDQIPMDQLRTTMVEALDRQLRMMAEGFRSLLG